MNSENANLVVCRVMEDVFRVRIKPFMEFAYGDRRKDRSVVSQALSEMNKGYDPAADRYKQFREALTSFESGTLSKLEFINLFNSVTPSKRDGYKNLSRNYLDLK